MTIRFAAAGLLLILPGCHDGPQVVRPLAPAKVKVVYPDLPAPEGFLYVKNLSHTSPTGVFRVVNQRLLGKDRRIETAAKFYREAFPPQGWRLEREEGAAPRPVTFSFSKGDESCRVRVADTPSEGVEVVLEVDRK